MTLITQIGIRPETRHYKYVAMRLRNYKYAKFTKSRGDMNININKSGRRARRI